VETSTYFYMGDSHRRGVFRWRIDRDDTPTVLRDLSWEFAEPDQYAELIGQQKPGLMASKGEKAIHAALSTGDPSEIVRVAGQYPKYAVAANTIAGLLSLETSVSRGIELLRTAVDSGEEVHKDHFIRKYLPEAGLSVVIAEGLMVRLPLSHTAIVLLLAELYQTRERLDEAHTVLDSTESTTHVRLSKAELYYQQGRFDDVVAITEGTVNDDDFTALLLAYRGRALAELGRDGEAVAAFAQVLEYPNRAEAVRALALVGRGMIHQARGEFILAENDFTQALTEVPDDTAARSHIEQLMRDPGGQEGR
jgi:tetratricopeptide (TPR) repeat protein